MLFLDIRSKERMEKHQLHTINIGIDIGSVSVNVLVIDEEYQIRQDAYIRHKGRRG